MTFDRQRGELDGSLSALPRFTSWPHHDRKSNLLNLTHTTAALCLPPGNRSQFDVGRAGRSSASSTCNYSKTYRMKLESGKHLTPVQNLGLVISPPRGEVLADGHYLRTATICGGLPSRSATGTISNQNSYNFHRYSETGSGHRSNCENFAQTYVPQKGTT
jgi:hypothetical protein